MKPYISYIIETALSLGIFTVVYLLFLRKETRFNANRFLFDGCFIVFNIFTVHIDKNKLINISTVSVESQVDSFQGTNLLETITVYASGFPAKVSNVILSFNFSVLIYFLGAAAALFLIITGIYQLLKIVTANRKFNLKGQNLLFQKRKQPHIHFSTSFSLEVI
jgi:hypothetical protein